MARFETGHPRLPGAGRKKGRPNNATRNAREAIAGLIDGNIDRLQGWLDEIAEKDGALAALRCLLNLLEYHVPKLTRAELTIDKPDNERNTVDASTLSYEDRQALREILERYQEIMDRYHETPREVAPGTDPEDAIDSEESTTLNAEGIGDYNE